MSIWFTWVKLSLTFLHFAPNSLEKNLTLEVPTPQKWFKLGCIFNDNENEAENKK